MHSRTPRPFPGFIPLTSGSLYELPRNGGETCNASGSMWLCSILMLLQPCSVSRRGVNEIAVAAFSMNCRLLIVFPVLGSRDHADNRAQRRRRKRHRGWRASVIFRFIYLRREGKLTSMRTLRCYSADLTHLRENWRTRNWRGCRNLSCQLGD